MNIDKIFGRTYDLIKVRMGLDVKESELISGNIANISTPHYVAKQLSFQNTLEKMIDEPSISLQTTNAKHFSYGMGGPDEDEFVVKKTGPVDLDKELSALTENSLNYRALVTILTKKFNMLKTAMSEGGR